jgi:hypothetical protein
MPFRHKAVGAPRAFYVYIIDNKCFCLNYGTLASLLL